MQKKETLPPLDPGYFSQVLEQANCARQEDKVMMFDQQRAQEFLDSGVAFPENDFKSCILPQFKQDKQVFAFLSKLFTDPKYRALPDKELPLELRMFQRLRANYHKSVFRLCNCSFAQQEILDNQLKQFKEIHGRIIRRVSEKHKTPSPPPRAQPLIKPAVLSIPPQPATGEDITQLTKRVKVLEACRREQEVIIQQLKLEKEELKDKLIFAYEMSARYCENK